MAGQRLINPRLAKGKVRWALLVAALALCASILGAGTASAEVTEGTVLCKKAENTCIPANQYGSGTAVEATKKSGSTWTIETVYKNLTCSSSSLGGKLTGGGGPKQSVPVEITAASFGECNATVEAESLPWHGSVSYTKAGSGTLHLTDMKLYTKASTIFGNVTCYYGGAVDMAFNGGAPSEITASKANLNVLSGSNGLCNEQHTWTVSYTNTAPSPAYVELPEVGTVLCKTAEEPCQVSNRYLGGTEITATNEGNVVFSTALESRTCKKSEIKATLTAAGGLGEPQRATVTKYTFSECFYPTQAYALGAFDIYDFGDGTHRGAMTQPNTIIKQSPPETELNCLYEGPSSPSYTEKEAITLEPGSPAAIHFNHVPLTMVMPVKGCSSGLTLDAKYTVSPSPLYVSHG